MSAQRPFNLNNKTNHIEIDFGSNLQHQFAKGSYDVTISDPGTLDSIAMVRVILRKAGEISDILELDYRYASSPSFASAEELKDQLDAWNIPANKIADADGNQIELQLNDTTGKYELPGVINLPVNIQSSDSPSIDAFGRWRTSDVETLFDSKQTGVGSQIFWDDQQTSGTGTSSTYSENGAKTVIAVSNATVGTRIRQTKLRFNYFPGKSQLILITFNFNNGAAGISKKSGYFDQDNGLFFELINGTYYFTRRTNVTGTPVDNRIAKANWNIDPMDGNGISGVNLDFTKTQILFIDFEWLGVGRVRFGWVVDGMIYYAHELNNANNLADVYMSKPNLPIRYEISNDGTGVADEIDAICCSVSSEGGTTNLGIIRSEKTIDAGLAINTKAFRAVIGLRLKSTELDLNVLIESVSLICEGTGDAFRWDILLNPTVADTFTYADYDTDSGVQTATGTVANIVSGGKSLLSGFGKDDGNVNFPVNEAYRLGSLIDGTRDIIVLAVYNITQNTTIHAALNWRELL